MSAEMIILNEDREWARRRIAKLDADIQALGPEFYEVFNQSSETWHDNAPFDALRDRQSVLDAERQYLRQILRASLPAVPRQWPNRVGVGSLVELQDGQGKTGHYFIAGDWTAFTGQQREGAVIMSCNAPLAKELIGKKVGDSVRLASGEKRITSLRSHRS